MQDLFIFIIYYILITIYKIIITRCKIIIAVKFAKLEILSSLFYQAYPNLDIKHFCCNNTMHNKDIYDCNSMSTSLSLLLPLSFEQIWKDVRLSWVNRTKYAEISSIVVAAENLWLPDMALQNRCSIDLVMPQTQLSRRVYVFAQCTITGFLYLLVVSLSSVCLALSLIIQTLPILVIGLEGPQASLPQQQTLFC